MLARLISVGPWWRLYQNHCFDGNVLRIEHGPLDLLFVIAGDARPGADVFARRLITQLQRSHEALHRWIVSVLPDGHERQHALLRLVELSYARVAVFLAEVVSFK